MWTENKEGKNYALKINKFMQSAGLKKNIHTSVTCECTGTVIYYGDEWTIGIFSSVFINLQEK